MSVPDTSTFNLQNVVNEVNPTTDDLVDCFSDAIDASYDYNYKGDKTNLLNFRNYNNTTPGWAYIIDIKTTPWFIGASLDVSQYNIIQLVYTYPFTTKTENISRGVKNAADDTDLIGISAVNASIYNTVRPKIVTLRDTHYEMVAVPEVSLYYILDLNSYWWTKNPNVTYHSATGYFRKYFNKVNSATVTGTFNKSSLSFDNDKNPITTNSLSITSNCDWYIFCPDWLSLNKYYGTGNDTITITIDTSGLTGDVSLYKTTNSAPSVCHIAYEYMDLSNSFLNFNAAGVAQGDDHTTVTTPDDWISSKIDTGDGIDWVLGVIPSSGNAGATDSTITVNTNSGASRACIIRYICGDASANVIITQYAP
jgi:hypothetical protein